MLRPRRLVVATLLVTGSLAAPAFAAFEQAFDPAGTGPLYPAIADGRVTPVPSLTACRLAPGETVVVDGRLDDAVWTRAEAGFGLVRHEPDRWGQVSVETVFKVAYDLDAIYFAAACWEDDMSRVARRLARRDNIQSSDFVSFYIDPYHDRLTGYNFRITADGVKADHYLYDDVERDTDWEAVWDAETWEDDRGWYVEVRVPFQAIRFRPAASMTWGLQFYRWLHGRGEDTGWATWDRNEQGFVSRWGTLTGIDGVTNPRRLEVLPYVAGGLVDEADPADEDESFSRYFNWGADFKYNLTSALTAQATVQPDFGQVEADPALLNLSPFETFYEEKRPFFVEGARFFTHPQFNLFYSRRIGTGDTGSRIRAAGKLTGKIGGQTTVAALGAFTDVAPANRAHNPFVRGGQETGYGVLRLARDLDRGNHRVGLMATGVWRRDTGRTDPVVANGHRDAYSGGIDWNFSFLDKAWGVAGSTVGTVLDPHPVRDDPTVAHDAVSGTAGNLVLSKTSGAWRAQASGSWESDRFDPNDLGYLSSNDEITTNVWVQHRYDAEGRDSLLKSSYPFLQVWRNWLYGDQRRLTATTGDEVWAHGKGHRQDTGVYAEWYLQTHSYWNLTLALEHGFESTSKYLTRSFAGERGPLMTSKPYTGTFIYLQTDWRRDLVHEGEARYIVNEVGSQVWELEYGIQWNAGRHLITQLDLSYEDHDEDAQWLDNLADPDTGIDGVAYVFGRLRQQIVDATLRASWLFDRDRSLELYLQPYLTTGEYASPRYLARPDSRDLRPYVLDASQYDFDFAALNLNLVWRWEYRPGSTIFLVWTHGRTTYDERQFHGAVADFEGGLGPGRLFDQEPRNTVLVKVNYWFSI
ncbi:MAG TPA: DUF5916 domain-containing protein [Candidatus Krumholzibacteria bacterium]|nr:DUF5916 domain-containing protein [Candidatus Krumholzibacteria bacterium]HPD73159.1 DUF5916 domain-containing protein [Candidatus Krumholzibacteria bacterium]HRY41963.1 DUF5916 domain-containing protein [Candidatus Krumholzibacteria bacterium]